MTTEPLPHLVRRMLLGYRSAATWSVTAELLETTVEDAPTESGRLSIGRARGLQWSGFGPSTQIPDTLVTGTAAFVRGLKAAYAISPPLPLDQLDRILRNRWVNTSSEALRLQGWESAEQQFDDLMYSVTDDALATCKTLAENKESRSIIVECANQRWRLYPDEGIWTTARLAQYYVNVRFQYGDLSTSPSIPSAEDVFDVSKLPGPAGRLGVSKATAVSPDISPSEGGTAAWGVTHASLDELLGVENCVQAQHVVLSALRHDDIDLVRRIQFDSELSLFAAYCVTRTDALALSALIDHLISEHASGAKHVDPN